MTPLLARIAAAGALAFVLVLAPAPAGPPVIVADAQPPSDALREALGRALEDERRAIAFYERVNTTFDHRRPFSRIVDAERRHEAALLAQFERLDLVPPVVRGTDELPAMPATFREACDLAEFAEIENVRLYDELIESIDDESVRDVFHRLRLASAERHLPAFRRHGSGWQVLAEPLSDARDAQKKRADAARLDLFGALLSRLGEEINSAGYASAIAVCRDEAPTVAAGIAKAHDVRIGRTSWKLRNPANTGPGWLTLVLHERPEEPRLLADRTGRLGAVVPIRIAETCLPCHGPRESIDPAVRSRLDELYPADRATGFAAGDLRGWFWIEVPPAR